MRSCTPAASAGVSEESSRAAAMPPRLERLDLILHQGDQWRDDDRQAVQEQAGQLVAERLAGPRGKEGERTAAGQQRPDHLLLSGAE